LGVGFYDPAPILEKLLINQNQSHILNKMEAKTFILTNTKTWSRQVRVFILNQNKKYEERLLPFTTERVVNSKQRSERGRTVAAEYVTSDPVIIAALYRDSAYGKDFIQKGDTEGKLKAPTIIINDNDRQIVALRGLFKIAGIPFDETLPYDVSKEMYEIHMSSLAGKKQEPSVTEIPLNKVDVKASIQDGINAARQKYEEDYGDPIPAIVANDLAFLDGLSNPNFDAQKYIEEKEAEAEKGNTKEDAPAGGAEQKEDAPVNEKETLHASFFAKFGKKVPNMKASDMAWIKAKIEE
jgi:hypothetical protein